MHEIKTEKQAITALNENGWNIREVPSDLLNQRLVDIAVDYADKKKDGELLLVILNIAPQEFIPKKMIEWLIEHVKIEHHNDTLRHTFEGRLAGGVTASHLVKLVKKINPSFWTNELTVICHDVVKNINDGLYLKYVPEERMTQEMCIDAVSNSPGALESVPVRFKTNQMCLQAAQAGFTSGEFFKILKWVPRDCMSEELEKLCIEKISQKGSYGQFSSIPKEIRMLSISLFAVQQAWDNLRHVPDEFKTSEVYFHAVKQNGKILKQVPRELKSVEMCLAGVKQDGWLLQSCIPDDLKTEEICLEAVKHDGDILKYVPENLRTAKICLEAVKKTGRAYDLIPERIRTPEMLETAKSNLYIEKVSAEQLSTMDKYKAALTDQTKYMSQETKDLLNEQLRTTSKAGEGAAIEQQKKAVEALVAAIYPQAVQKTVMNAYLNNLGSGKLDYWEAIRKSLEEARAASSN